MFLSPTENVSVSLLSKGSTSKCYGEVHIKKNNAYYPVCGTVWSEKDAEVVCKELQCGKVSFQCLVCVFNASLLACCSVVDKWGRQNKLRYMDTPSEATHPLSGEFRSSRPEWSIVHLQT